MVRACKYRSEVKPYCMHPRVIVCHRGGSFKECFRPESTVEEMCAHHATNSMLEQRHARHGIPARAPFSHPYEVEKSNAKRGVKKSPHPLPLPQLIRPHILLVLPLHRIRRIQQMRHTPPSRRGSRATKDIFER